ncbi:PepSY domain-containing protein [Chitinophaga sp. Mgbs1]|uniref:PepSY domain-containing protein n=1 Tax=Chitinophaga solisilvae TaxID=1233460 RepID=A0A433W915_9BACT|nr:PepSY domain-containing protein [Chitinophaga solisilvae]
MKQHWRKQLFRLHRISGLIAGAFILFLSLSGSILVFSDEIDHAMFRHAYEVTPGTRQKPLSELMDNAGKALRGSNPYLSVTRLPQAPDECIIIRREFTPDYKVYLFMDPYTGRVLHQQSNTGYFTGYLLYLHFTLMSGTTGAVIVFIVGIMLFISILTGIWVYRNAIGKVLSFRVKLEWHNRTRRWRNLHRIIGVWALLFNLLIAFTGFMIELKVIDSRNKPAAVSERIATPGVDYDQLMTVSRQQIPGFVPMGLRPPRKAGDPVRILGHAAEPAIWGRYSSSVSFDPATGAVKKTVNFSKAGPGDKFNACIAPLHFGNFGGIPVKILYSLLALTPGILSISGFLIWYRRKFIIKTHRI